jgi:hypothetical protein
MTLRGRTRLSPPPIQTGLHLRSWRDSVLTVLLGCSLLAGCAAAPFRAVDLRVTHRMFPRFNEEHTAVPGERFQVGDTDYSAKLVGFVPDFVLDEKTGKVSSRSSQPRNPAFEVEVFQADTLVERAWAFMKGSPPHFSRHSMLNFEIEHIDWKPGEAPLDSTAAPDSAQGHS